MAEGGTLKVWDGFVRLFHWSLLAGVATAAITGFLVGGRAIDIHIWAGTAAVALVALRLVWGFLGPGPARFAGFLAGPRSALAHLRESHRHLGHNPLGGWMVVALLALVLALGATGTALLGGMFHVGPARAWLTVAEGRGVAELHEAFAFGLLGLVALHLGGVAFESRRSGENLARAMVTGRKQARPGDLPLPRARAHPLLAALIGGAGMLAMGALIAALADAPVPDAPVSLAGTDYAAQCADCHIAYHPSLLPAASWAQIMSGLDDHFGEDASLPEADTAALAAFLAAHSAETTDSKPAVLFRGASGIAITETPAWDRIHDELPEAIFAAAPVLSEGNCAACHGDADTGWFYPGRIDLPQRATGTTPTEDKDD